MAVLGENPKCFCDRRLDGYALAYNAARVIVHISSGLTPSNTVTATPVTAHNVTR
jgi:hypothetical protein